MWIQVQHSEVGQSGDTHHHRVKVLRPIIWSLQRNFKGSFLNFVPQLLLLAEIISQTRDLYSWGMTCISKEVNSTNTPLFYYYIIKTFTLNRKCVWKPI